MCGFCGYYSIKSTVSQNVLYDMSNTLNHRGPDNQNIWIDHVQNIGFAHNRLSILDVSPAGNQPMKSTSGRFIICFNGEIYNHLQLRKKIANLGHTFDYKGQSDTETLLCCFDVFGIKKTIQESVGMFAFAVYDNIEKKLILGRDRFGEKPLYYGWNKGNFYFGSELKAFKRNPSFSPQINFNSLSNFMEYSYIPSPESIFEGINKLIPGNLLTVSLVDNIENSSIESYWNLHSIVNQSINKNLFKGSDVDAISILEHLLSESVKMQQLSDVPVGAFLSGGIDSSLIVALMQSQSSIPVNTFTIGFIEDIYNEAKYASKVADYLGTNHHEIFIESKDVVDVIPLLPFLYDEPFADSSQIPTFLVSQLARKYVKVSLSGDAGDEIFGGYNRYNQAARFKKYPFFLKSFIANSILSCNANQLKTFYQIIKPILPTTFKSSNPAEHLVKIASILNLKSDWEIYQKLVKTGLSSNILISSNEYNPKSRQYFDFLPKDSDFSSRMMFTDILTYLPDDILCKVDRAAMGVSLETRVPFLDPSIVDFAWRLPMNMKIRNGRGKWILRELLKKYVPSNLIERPKMGFALPIDSWLRHSLKEWAESLLTEKELNESGYFNTKYVRKIWQSHLTGQKNHQHQLWNILMFRAWQKYWI